MGRWKIKPWYTVAAVGGAFFIAALSFSGLLFRNNSATQLGVGTVCGLISLSGTAYHWYARRRAQEQKVQHLRQRLLTQAQEAAAQQERARLARELHDSIKQQLFRINMGAAAAQTRWADDPPGAQQALDDVQRGAQEAMVEMNALLQQLSPAPLEKVGLVQALRDQCEALGYRTDAEVTAEFGALPADDALPAGAEGSLFRIAQEAFSNVARHARADHVRLYLGQQEDALALEIEDDGQGFVAGTSEGGMGLENIRQRARALGGTLDLTGAPGQGTTLRVTVPLVQTTAREDTTAGAHAVNQVFLAGLCGGLVLLVTLFYPLYVDLPGRYVAGWPASSSALSLACQVLAAAVAIATGVAAARWARAGTRSGSALCGAVAGVVAGATLTLGLGAAAASVVGGADLLARGLVPASGRAEILRLLASATIGIVRTTHATFLAALGVGTGLGAVGGVLGRTTSSHRPDLQAEIKTVLNVTVMASALALCAAVPFALLEPTLRQGLRANGVTLTGAPSLARASDWAIGTPALLYLASLAARYALLHVEIRQTEDRPSLCAARVTAAFFGLVSLAVPVYLFAMGSPTWLQSAAVLPAGWMDVARLPHPDATALKQTLGTPLLAGLALSLMMGGGYLAAGYAAYRRQRASGLSPRPLIYEMSFVSVLLSPGLIAWGGRLARSHAILSQGVSTLVGLALVGVSLGLAVSLRRSSKVRPPLPVCQVLTLQPLIHAGLGAVVALALPFTTVASTHVGINLITPKLVEVLTGSESAVHEFTLDGLVRGLYINQADAALLTFVGSAALVGLLILILSGILNLPDQLTAGHKDRPA